MLGELVMTKSADSLAAHPGLRSRLRSLVVEAGHLTVGLVPSFGGVPISRSRRRRICREALDPLNDACDRILVYNLNETDRHVRKHLSHFTARGGRHEFDLAGKHWADFDSLLYRSPLFSSIANARGSIVSCCRHSKVPWTKVLSACFNPLVIGNLSVYTGRSPIQFARRHLDAERCFIIVGNSNSGLENLTVIAARESLLSVFDIASERCELGSSYMLLHPEELHSTRQMEDIVA